MTKAVHLLSMLEAVTQDKVAAHFRSTEHNVDDMETYHNILARHHEGSWKKIKVPLDRVHGHHEGHADSANNIKDFADRAKKGSKLPAIIAKPHPTKAGHFVTIDGQHRVAAAKSLGHTHIDAYVPHGE